MIRFFSGLLGLCLLLAGTVVSAQNTGVSFQDNSFDAALAKARQQNKSVFVEIYLNGCPHCQAIEPLLKDPKVGEFYNANFVSLQLEANSDASKKLQQQKQLTYPEFPLFLFFERDGRLKHLATPQEKKTHGEFAEELISTGRAALDPQQATSRYPERFASGDRQLAFLVQYGKYAKAVRDTAAQNRLDQAFGQQLQTPEQRTDAVGFYILRRFVTRFDNPLSTYFFSHFADYQSRFPKEEVKEAVESIAFQSLFGSGARAWPSAAIATMREGMVKAGIPAHDAASRTLLKELEALFREKNTPEAVARFNAFRAGGKTETADYAYLIRYFNEQAPDGRYLSAVPAWSAAALAGVTPQAGPAAADLYHALGVAYKRKGDVESAKKMAAKGKETAGRLHQDTRRFDAPMK